MQRRVMDAKRLSDRTFGLVFAGIFGAIATVLWAVGGVLHLWLVVVAAVIMATALLWPLLLMPFNRLWMQFGLALGSVTNAVLLSVFYFLMITPFGIVRRLVSSDPMERRTDAAADSYFSPVRRQAKPDNFADMF